METYGKTMGKPWKHIEKQWENHGNLWKNNGKTMETYGKTMGKPWKYMENHGTLVEHWCVLLFFDERCWKNMEDHGKYGKRYGNHIKCWNNTGKDMGNGWELGEWWKHIGRIWWTLPWTCLDNQSCRIAFSWHCIHFINRAIPPHMFSKDIYIYTIIHNIYIYTLYIYIYVYIYTCYIYICIYTLYIYIYTLLHTHYIYIHIHTYTHTYLYIYIYNVCMSAETTDQQLDRWMSQTEGRTSATGTAFFSPVAKRSGSTELIVVNNG